MALFDSRWNRGQHVGEDLWARCGGVAFGLPRKRFGNNNPLDVLPVGRQGRHVVGGARIEPSINCGVPAPVSSTEIMVPNYESTWSSAEMKVCGHVQRGGDTHRVRKSEVH